MDIQVYIDTRDLDSETKNELTPKAHKDMSEWITQQSQNISMISGANDELEEADKLGMHIQVKSAYKLKDALNFLYALAKTYKCEFVIAQIQPDSDLAEDVCYFGYEEGRPDLFEIANYLSL